VELAHVLQLLDLETVEQDLFRGAQPATSTQRVFGGQVAAQALVAASRTVPSDRFVHSLHAYFLRAGVPDVPIVYRADRLRDGGAFSSRRVLATQDAVPIFSMTASFSPDMEGVEYQDPMPDVPGPEGLPRLEERLAPYADEHDGFWVRPRPFDLRYVGTPPRAAVDLDELPVPGNQVWIRAEGDVPDDRVLQSCLLTYVSDLTLLDSVLIATRRSYLEPGPTIASLDHAVWFHRSFSMNDWLLYDQHSSSGSSRRGLAGGRIFDRQGNLVCSVVQEGFLSRKSLTPPSRATMPGAAAVPPAEGGSS